MSSKTEAAPTSQHMQALARANKARLRIAEIKKDLKAGKVSVRQALEDPAMANQPVMTAVMAQYRWGRSRARRALAMVPVSETKPCASLTERQKNALTAIIEGREIEGRW